eukprot:SAG31_NODE_7167_length_1768_cov_1.581186_2_plen_146_part_00
MIVHWQDHPQESLPRPPEAKARPGEADLSIFASMEPRAVVASRGQALLFTQSLVHAGWHNSDKSPRKAIYTTWCTRAAISMIGGTVTPETKRGQIDELRQIHTRLGRALAPLGRGGIVLTAREIEMAARAWEEKWPPTLRHRNRL